MSRYYRSFLEESVITPSYTARTTAFASATAITDLTILNALNTFDLGLISNGLDTKMKALYPFVGSTATTHKYNFMDARDLDVAFRLQFNGGWTHSSTGALPNGTNAFAYTYLIPAVSLSLNNGHFSCYSRTNLNAITTYGGQGCLGNEAQTSAINLTIKRHDSLTYGQIYSTTYTANAGTSINGAGFFNINRQSNVDLKLLRNNTIIASNTVNQTDASLPLRNVCLGAIHNIYEGEIRYYDNKQIAFSSIGDGLTDTDISNLYNLVQAMQTTLTRNV